MDRDYTSNSGKPHQVRVKDLSIGYSAEVNAERPIRCWILGCQDAIFSCMSAKATPMTTINANVYVDGTGGVIDKPGKVI